MKSLCTRSYVWTPSEIVSVDYFVYFSHFIIFLLKTSNFGLYIIATPNSDFLPPGDSCYYSWFICLVTCLDYTCGVYFLAVCGLWCLCSVSRTNLQFFLFLGPASYGLLLGHYKLVVSQWLVRDCLTSKAFALWYGICMYVCLCVCAYMYVLDNVFKVQWVYKSDPPPRPFFFLLTVFTRPLGQQWMSSLLGPSLFSSN